jgi:hypothetical protein
MEANSVAAEQHVDKMLAAFKAKTLADLPRDVRKRIRKEARQIALNDVFGHGHKIGKDGEPVEQGLGSFENPSQQSIDAYIKAQTDKRYRESPEEGFEENVKRMRARFAEVQAQRRKLKAAEDDEED